MANVNEGVSFSESRPSLSEHTGFQLRRPTLDKRDVKLDPDGDRQSLQDILGDESDEETDVQMLDNDFHMPVILSKGFNTVFYIQFWGPKNENLCCSVKNLPHYPLISSYSNLPFEFIIAGA